MKNYLKPEVNQLECDESLGYKILDFNDKQLTHKDKYVFKRC